MCHRLQLVVDEELGGHHDEAECQEEAIHGSRDETVPALVFVVHHRVDAVAEGEGEESHAQVFKCKSVKLLGPGVLVVFLIVQLQSGDQATNFVLKVERNILDLGDFPHLYGQSNEAGDPDDCVGVVVKDVEKNDQVLEHIEENRTD